RWWDTTNSFHFSATGDMTMTPLDFAMITGLDLGGGPIPYDEDMGQWEAAWMHLLGPASSETEVPEGSYTWFFPFPCHRWSPTRLSLSTKSPSFKFLDLTLLLKARAILPKRAPEKQSWLSGIISGLPPPSDLPGVETEVPAKIEQKLMKNERQAQTASRVVMAKDGGDRSGGGNGEVLTRYVCALLFIHSVRIKSKLFWVQCHPCINCFEQLSTIFDPSKSSTYDNISCNSTSCVSDTLQENCVSVTSCPYHYKYVDSSTTRGDLGMEEVRFISNKGTSVLSNILFGCGHENYGFIEAKENYGYNGIGLASGVLGLGPSKKLSLVSHLGSRFLYCIGNMSDLDYEYNRLVIGDDDAEIKGYSTPIQ
ncbi:Aspartic proteinase nepenthesin-2, partial [Camellia lanceoleosa]